MLTEAEVCAKHQRPLDPSDATLLNDLLPQTTVKRHMTKSNEAAAAIMVDAESGPPLTARGA